ncbi:hypothetical protein SCP_1800010 [Sparassis crispa]|uniref:F-box domain-containing protein n=1 Tax=Sparassis crispa TaxID=139825 RepID=A0A401H6G8_9APHY|nr:hypothetical protein SCP_1800010 [Sparassis crispa]GBE89979.1 hypothetical protein SCP_1800010 [Sparassis crispa]
MMAGQSHPDFLGAPSARSYRELLDIGSLSRPYFHEDSKQADSTALQYSLGSSCYINELAPELLATTFLHVLDPMAAPHWELFIWPSATLKSTRKLIKLKQVCRYWREICVNTPSLSNTVHDFRGSNSSIIQEVIKCGTISLNVCVDRYFPSPVTLPLFKSGGWRIHNLHLYFPEDRSFAFRLTAQPNNHGLAHESLEPLELQHIHLCTDFPASALEHFTVSSSAIEGGPFYPTLFQDHAPQLKTLALRSSTWLPANMFISLTHLYICLSFKRIRHVQPLRNSVWVLPRLLIFMAGCPNLEVVSLWNIFSAWTVLDGIPSITLRRLERLEIGGAHQDVIKWLLKHITIPADFAAVRISNVVCTSGGSELKVLLPLLPSIDPGTMHVRQTSNGLSVSITDSSSSIGVETVRSNPEAEIWTPTVWALWHLEGVQELYLIGTHEVVIEFFAGIYELLKQLPLLSTLVYRDSAPPNLLFEYLSPPVNTTPNGPPCPHLSTLRICIPEGTTLDFPKLVAFTETRARAGHPLHRVTLEFESHASDLHAEVEVLGTYVEFVELREYDTTSASMSLPVPATCTLTSDATGQLWGT